MAVINLSVTVPDAQITRVQAALRAIHGDTLTNPELIEKLRLDVIQMLKGIVIRYERGLAIKAAESLEPQVDAT